MFLLFKMNVITLICFVGFIRNGLTERYQECLDIVCPSIENDKLNCPPDSKPIIIDPSATNSHDSTLWERALNEGRALSNHHPRFARFIPKSRTRREVDEGLKEFCCPSRKCICSDCKVPKCESKNHTAIIKVQNTNKPGSCCPKYECEEKPDCSNMELNGYTWLEHCAKCECRNNELLCHTTCVEKTPCFEGIQLYMDGSHWKRDDCTDCYCDNGLAKCKISHCRPLSCHKTIQIQNSCCPICDKTNSLFCPGSENCGIVCKYNYLKSDDGCFLCKCAPYEINTIRKAVPSNVSTTEAPSDNTTITFNKTAMPFDKINADETIKRENQWNIIKFVIIVGCGIIGLSLIICFIVCMRGQIIKSKTKYNPVDQTNSNSSDTSSAKTIK